MRSIRDPDLGRRLPSMVADLRTERTALGILRVVMEYIVQANDRVSEDELVEALRTAEPEGGGLMPTLAEQWIQRGRLEGQREGRAEGQRVGRVATLHTAIRDALEARFGLEARALAAQLPDALDAEALREVHRAVLRAHSLEEASRAIQLA